MTFFAVVAIILFQRTAVVCCGSAGQVEDFLIRNIELDLLLVHLDRRVFGHQLVHFLLVIAEYLEHVNAVYRGVVEVLVAVLRPPLRQWPAAGNAVAIFGL